MTRLRALFCAVLLVSSLRGGRAQQTSVSAPGLRLQGLRSSNAHGSFKASAYLPDGSLVLLYDQGDGLRLLKTDGSAAAVLAQAQGGAAGDSGTVLCLDTAGNIYVAGTSSSGLLAGTPGAAFPASADTSTNSFLAKFDSQLQLVFLTFLGAGRTEVTGLAATPDAVFVSGANYNGSLPTTAGALQRTPPNTNYGSGNGFVQRFFTDGTALRYGTYLNGSDGGSVPAAIVARTDDSLYVAGETSASTFPAVNALQPAIAGPVSGFLARLSPDASTLQFSTYIAGSGISSVAVDSATNTLLATGNLAFGQFPVAQVNAPLAQTPYQSLLRLSADGQSFLDSVLLLPGTQSFVTPARGGTAWVSSTLSIPLSPETMNRGLGDSYVLHVTSSAQIDQLQRIGGSATSNAAFARLSTTVSAPSISPDGQFLTVAGTVLAQTDPSLRTDQSFDLALNAGTSNVLPNSLQDLLPPSCTAGQSCAGSGGLLTQIALSNTQPSLALSTGDLPNVTLRNTGSTAAPGLSISAAGFTTSTNCSDTLAPFAQCAIALSGPGPGTLSITSTNAPALNASIPPAVAQAQPLAFDTPELDFGIVTASGSPAVRVITVQNLSTALQTFTSSAQNVPSALPYTIAEVGGTCPGPPSAHTIAPQASCTVQIGLTASASAQNDGPVQASWQLGARDIPVTAFTQAAALSLSAAEIDFGAQSVSSTARLPRFLYLSNSSPAAIPHTAVSLPPQSPFSALDGCPATLPPDSVCGITLTYSQPNAPVFDSTTLTLDQGLSVLLSGETLTSTAAVIAMAPSPLLLSPGAVQFTSPVPVSQQSAEIQTVQVTNPTATEVPFAASVLGDFTLQTNCGASLPGGTTCSLNLTFAPSQPGTRIGVLTVQSTPGAEPATVRLQGTAIPILGSTNGTLDLGETTVGEPTIAWLQLQGSFPQLTATVNAPDFTVALLADHGNGHGTLPPSAFAASTTAQCTECWLAIRFLPQTLGSAQALLQLASQAEGYPYQLALQAAAHPAQGLVLTPSQQSFGAVAQGTSSTPVSFVLSNLLQPQAAAPIRQISISGDFALSAAPSPTACAVTLQPTASCSIAIVFTPTAKGRRTGTLTVTTSAGTATASLLGISIVNSGSSAPSTPVAPPVPAVSVFPTQADFGPQPVATISGFRQFTLINTSSTSQSVTLAASKNFPFAQASVCNTLPAGGLCTFTVAFVPAQGGPLTGSITITSQAQGSASTTQTVLYLQGYGTATGGLTASSGTEPQTPVSFGNIASGASATQTFTLTNNGSQPHSLRRLSSTTPFQAATTCTQPLLPGTACKVTVTYSALNQVAGTATQTPRTDLGTVLLESDTDASPLTVYLKGTTLPASATASSQPVSLPTYTLSGTALTFPNTQPSAASPAQVITAANNGVVPVVFDGLLPSAGYDSSTTCSVLQPRETCLITVSFHPTQLSSTPSIGSLEISSNAATALELVSLLGSSFPTQLQLSPESLTFGSVPLGKTAQQSVTVTNPSSLPAALGKFQVTGDFTVDAGACPAGSSLPTGQSCMLVITFTPSSTGPRTGSMASADGATTSPQSISLTGAGIAGKLQVQPGSLDFGSIPPSTSSSRTLTLANVGSAPLESLLLSITGTDAADFSLTSACSGTELAVAASCSVSLSFAPSITGQRQASLVITSTDPSSPTVVPLTGTGSQPPGFTLSVSGGSTATANLKIGGSATFPLTLTSQGGYTGAIALNCAPIAPAPNADCSLAAAQLMLPGSAVTSSVSVSTLSGFQSGLLLPFGLWSLLPCASLVRKKNQTRRPVSIAITLASVGITAAVLAGCGRGPGSTGYPYTPPGTYQYQVTAASTSGQPLSSSVTLSITVH